MIRNIAIVALVIAAIGFICAPSKAAKQQSTQKSPAAYTEKVVPTPDLTQTDPDGKLPIQGKSHCGPVSVSNSLAWLANNGFDNLLPTLKNRKQSQFEMARLLGSKMYMNTTSKGTGVGGVAQGVSRYIKDRGYEYRYLKYQGWRKHPSQFSTAVDVPKLSWIKEGLKGNSAVWLNVGWYKYDYSTGEYLRTGGHWVTLVGYGVDQKGNVDPSVLIIHDPSPGAGKYPSHEYVRIKPISKGKLTGTQSGLPRSAKGYYIMDNGMHISRKANVGILDGVVVLKMPNK